VTSENIANSAPDFISQAKEIAAILTAIVGVSGFLHGFYNSRKIRKSELRWKQAIAAKDNVDTIHKHENARHALTILDWVDISIKDQSEMRLSQTY
jgi:hypothetical protein